MVISGALSALIHRVALSRIGLKTREAVHALAGQLKYSPNAAALNFRSGKSGIIGVVLPEIKENFFSEAINGVEAVVLNEKYGKSRSWRPWLQTESKFQGQVIPKGRF